MAVPLWYIVNDLRRIPKQRKLLDSLSDFEIRKNCGVPWWGARELVDIFQPLEGIRSSSVPLETKVISFLSYLRSGNFQWSLGTLAGISQSSTSRIIEACCNHCVSIARQYIRFPTVIQECNLSKRKLYDIAKIPNIIGIVDGTHVSIEAPTQNEDIYVNRKLTHSINCQIVANRDYYILDVVAKWPGSSHDSFVWANSSVRERLKLGHLGEGYFLGDTGYPLEPWLLTPYPNNTDVDLQRRFNKAHKSTRSVVERAIGNWKSRFRSMCKTGGISCYHEAKVCKLIISTVVLHNICIQKGIPLSPEDEHYRDFEVIPELQEDNFAHLTDQQIKQQARDIRRNVALTLPHN